MYIYIYTQIIEVKTYYNNNNIYIIILARNASDVVISIIHT